jgi:hypothetical protein
VNHGSGSGNLVQGARVATLDELHEGSILIWETDNFDGCVNVVRVLAESKRPSPTDGFYGIFVDPADTTHLRLGDDQRFWVWWPPAEYDRFYHVQEAGK